jgi:hypothetical protein
MEGLAAQASAGRVPARESAKRHCPAPVLFHCALKGVNLAFSCSVFSREVIIEERFREGVFSLFLPLPATHILEFCYKRLVFSMAAVFSGNSSVFLAGTVLKTLRYKCTV